MKILSSIAIITALLTLTACGGALSTKDEAPPIMAQGGMTAAVTPEVTPETTVAETVPAVKVPRVKQSEIIGVMREMRNNGCIIKKFANTDGLQYSQLVITCGDPQTVPSVD